MYQINETQAFSPNSFSKINPRRALRKTNQVLNVASNEECFYNEISQMQNSSPLTKINRKKLHEQRRNEWTKRSLNYYSKIMRDNTGRESAAIDLLLGGNQLTSVGESVCKIDEEQLRTFAGLAKRLYFGRHKIKKHQPRHAERIYRKIIDEIIENRNSEEEHCDHAALAVSTLLLSLHLQRQGDVKGARSVFYNFFRTVFVNGSAPSECTCSAKVLQAFALFEVKRGHRSKGRELIVKAVSLDESLSPVLKWKQFQGLQRSILS